MCKRFEEWKDDISAYCVQNGLNFEKARSMVQCSNENMLVLQYYNSEIGKGAGLTDETPMPVVLWVTKQGSKLVFEQTKDTQIYLA
jgi:hypothetical protein